MFNVLAKQFFFLFYCETAVQLKSLINKEKYFNHFVRSVLQTRDGRDGYSGF